MLKHAGLGFHIVTVSSYPFGAMFKMYLVRIIGHYLKIASSLGKTFLNIACHGSNMPSLRNKAALLTTKCLCEPIVCDHDLCSTSDCL